MLNKNITKKTLFVTAFFAISLIFSNCRSLSSPDIEKPQRTSGKTSSAYSKPELIGTIKSPEIKESSGLVSSRCHPGVFWTHNDSGDSAFLYALDKKGVKLGTWQVNGAQNKDWEDIATFQDKSGKCFLYLGDIGNNGRKKSKFTIYKVAEPLITETSSESSRDNPSQTEPAAAIAFSYPDGTHDAETLLVHPETEEIYVLTKSLNEDSEIFKVGLKTEKIGNFTVPAVPAGFLTGGEIAPDGKHIIICDYVAGYELTLPDNAVSFDEIWKQNPVKIDLGEREQGEAICYSADSQKIYATSEKKNSPLIMLERK